MHVVMQTLASGYYFTINSNLQGHTMFNPIALKKAKIVYNFGLSECNRVKHCKLLHLHMLYYSAIYLFQILALATK